MAEIDGLAVVKTWLTADRLLEDFYRLANRILDSDFRPTHIVGIWRGGAPVGIAVQELLQYNGLECDHIAIRTASYAEIDRQNDKVRVYSLGYLIDTLHPADRLVLVDDVFDSGRSVQAFIRELAARCRHNMPNEVRIATVYWKPRGNQTALKPDFHVHETNDWLVFPHEICGLSVEEIRANKPQAAVILREGE